MARQLYVQRVRNDLEIWIHPVEPDHNHPAGMCARVLKPMSGLQIHRWSMPCPHGVLVVTENVPDELLQSALKYLDAEAA